MIKNCNNFVDCSVKGTEHLTKDVCNKDCDYYWNKRKAKKE